MFGVKEAREIFPRIEKGAKNHLTPEEGKKLMDQLTRLHTAVLAELEEYLATLG
jgi:hypothetical protein